MNQTIQAVYENGVFKPLYPVLLKLEKGERVEITIRKPEISEEDLTLNEKYFSGLSEDYIEDVITNALEDQEEE